MKSPNEDCVTALPDPKEFRYGDRVILCGGMAWRRGIEPEWEHDGRAEEWFRVTYNWVDAKIYVNIPAISVGVRVIADVGEYHVTWPDSK